jgi:exonuclease SbcD
VKDCIVRVKYECTDEQAKLIKANRIRQALYNAGAFYVAEIKPVITRTIRARSEEATADITPIKGLEIYCSLMGLKEVAELTAKAEGLLREVEA